MNWDNIKQMLFPKKRRIEELERQLIDANAKFEIEKSKNANSLDKIRELELAILEAAEKISLERKQKDQKISGQLEVIKKLNIKNSLLESRIQIIQSKKD